MAKKVETARRRQNKRLPDTSPWPPVGYVTLSQMMAAMGVRSAQTVYSYVQQDLLPEPVAIGPNRVGWPVALARSAIETLPERVRRNATGTTLTMRRKAAEVPA